MCEKKLKKEKKKKPIQITFFVCIFGFYYVTASP